MAKTKGALFSIDARGTIADLLTYQKVGAVRHVHKRLLRIDRQSAAQLSQRSAFSTAVSAWNDLSDEDKAAYALLAKAAGLVSGYHYYLRENIGVSQEYYQFGQVQFGENGKFGGP
jgi:20S proteasome alpha/beta subunit